MSARALLLVIAVVLSACTAASPSTTASPVPTREPGALNVSVLLDLSGPRAPSGGPQRDAMQLWVDRQPTGASPRVRLKIVDLAGSPSKMILELRKAAVEDRADAIVIGAVVDYDETFASAVQLAGVPVLFTLPVPDPASGAGGWAFALGPTPAQLARLTIEEAALHGRLSGALLVSDESTAAISERIALGAELASRGIAASVMKVTPADVARFRPMLALSRLIFLAGTPKPYLETARNATAGTFLYLSYLSEPGDLGELGDAAALASWPGSRAIAASATQSAARAAFTQSFTDRAGPPTTHAASAYDALTILALAADGGLEPTRLRDRLQAGTFAGIATTYSFSASRRAGFALEDLVFLRWRGARTPPAVR
jgi:ABC-type branched-subunit amino acid transport system substrate-binding protein